MDEYRRTGNDDSSFDCVTGYDDSVAIVPFSLVNAIGTAFEAYKKATLVQQFKDSYLEDSVPANPEQCTLDGYTFVFNPSGIDKDTEYRPGL
jgi:hypothetical protein